MQKAVFPFTAMVGQEEMKKALISNAVNPRIGGVLIRGEKGTAKSTAVPGLASLLPEVADCPFGCDPDDVAVMSADCRQRREAGEELPVATRKMRVVDLPVSATEDRAFKGKTAEVLLPPTNSVEMGYKLLQELPTGGRTPLVAGLLKAYEIIKAHFYKDPDLDPLLIVISDGRANVSMGEDKPLLEARRVAEIIRNDARIKTLVVDVEKDGLLTFGLARELAAALGAEYYRIDELKAGTLVQVVREMQGSGAEAKLKEIC